MNAKELKKFMQESRIEKKLTWDETAENAFILHNVSKSDGSPYSGAGFQVYVEKITGQKKWGTMLDIKSKAPFKKVKNPLVKEVPKFVPVKKNPELDELREILNSNLSDELKLKLIKSGV